MFFKLEQERNLISFVAQDGVEDDSDEDWASRNEADSETDEEIDYEEERVKNLQSRLSLAHECAAV